MNRKFRVLLLDTKANDPNYFIMLAIEAALKNHPDVEAVWNVPYDDALPVAIKNRCNLFFAYDGETLDRGLCQKLSAVCGKSLLWVSEDPYIINYNVQNADIFNLIFTNDRGSLKFYKGNVHHLPLGAFPKFHSYAIPNQDGTHYLYDFLFAGIAWPNRVELLKKIIPGLSGLKIKLALPYHKGLPKPNLGLPESAFLWRPSTQEMARFANRSRIVLTIHRDFSTSGKNTIASTPGPRIFETALAGGFQLVDLNIPEVSKYFQIGKEIAGFKTPEECLEQIRYYLSHPEERMAMVQAAQKKCFAEHLYHHRIESILHKVKTTPLPLTPAEGKPKRVRMEKKRILYVSHNLVGVDPFGGVEVYVDLLTKTLPEEYETLIYYPDRKDSSGKRIFLLNVKTSQKTEHTFEREYDASFLLDSERESWFRKILHQERIDLVHFQHMMGHPWSLPLIARSLGIPVLMTIPDYFPVCHRANLTSSEKQYCNIPHLPLVTCDICLQKNYGVIFGSQSSRRTFIAAIFENIDSIIFLSKSEREIVESLFPVLKGAPKVLVEGFPIVDRPFSLELRNNQNKVLTVAVPGNFKITKGADSLCKIFNAMRDEPVEFHIYGANHIRSGTFFSEISQALQGPNIKIHGPYSEDSLHENLLKADVSLLLSVWPETYVLTLSESWRAGVVPIVTDIGALGERVEDRVNGLKVPVDQPGSVVQLLREFIADRNELKRMRKNIHKGLYCKIDDHIGVITGLYAKLFDQYGVKSGNNAYFREYPASRKVSASHVFRNQERWANISFYLPGFQNEHKPIWKRKVNNAKAFMKRHGLKTFVKHSIRKLLLVDK